MTRSSTAQALVPEESDSASALARKPPVRREPRSRADSEHALWCAHRRHEVQCPICRCSFDLFAAPWCAHHEEPSKLCPHCSQCACSLPIYGEQHFWKEAPAAFQEQGFRRLFLYYL